MEKIRRETGKKGREKWKNVKAQEDAYKDFA